MTESHGSWSLRCHSSVALKIQPLHGKCKDYFGVLFFSSVNIFIHSILENVSFRLFFLSDVIFKTYFFTVHIQIKKVLYAVYLGLTWLVKILRWVLFSCHFWGLLPSPSAEVTASSSNILSIPDQGLFYQFVSWVWKKQATREGGNGTVFSRP